MSVKTIQKQSISAELAQQMIEAAVKEANKMGKKFTIAIVDDGGHLKAFLHMDGTPIMPIEIAIGKARTAVVFPMPTHEWHGFVSSDPALEFGVQSIQGITPLGGGFPIRLGDTVIGGIGVSGGSYQEDMQAAEAALTLVK